MCESPCRQGGNLVLFETLFAIKFFPSVGVRATDRMCLSNLIECSFLKNSHADFHRKLIHLFIIENFFFRSNLISCVFL